MQMQLCSFTLFETVTAVRIGHKFKLLVVLYQFIDEPFRALVMYVVITGAVYQQ